MLNNEMYESMQNMKTLDILISCMKTFNNPEHDVIVLTRRKGRGGVTCLCPLLQASHIRIASWHKFYSKYFNIN